MSELPIKLTTKAGTGFDAPWLTVDALDPNELAVKTQALIEHPTALANAVALANMLKAINALPEGSAPVQELAPQQYTQPVQVPQAQVVSNPPGWATAPAPQAAPQQQYAPPQQPQAAVGPRGERLHPEGKQCSVCGSVLMEKKTQNGKAKWQCEQWRWNNGTPNGHDMDWIN